MGMACISIGPLMVDVEGLELDDGDRKLLSSPAVGGVILFSRNFESSEQLKALCAEIRAVRSPPLLIAVDQEGAAGECRYGVANKLAGGGDHDQCQKYIP